MKKRIVLIDGIGPGGPLADAFEPTHLTVVRDYYPLFDHQSAAAVIPKVTSICEGMVECEDDGVLEESQQMIRTLCLESVLDLQEKLIAEGHQIVYTSAPLVDGVWGGHSDPHVVEEQLTEVLLEVESSGTELYIVTSRAVDKYGVLEVPYTLIEKDGDWYDLRMRCGVASDYGFAHIEEEDHVDTISLEEAYERALHCCRRS